LNYTRWKILELIVFESCHSPEGRRDGVSRVAATLAPGASTGENLK
jgi:hypothetical protein